MTRGCGVTARFIGRYPRSYKDEYSCSDCGFEGILKGMTYCPGCGKKVQNFEDDE